MSLSAQRKRRALFAAGCAVATVAGTVMAGAMSTTANADGEPGYYAVSGSTKGNLVKMGYDVIDHGRSERPGDVRVIATPHEVGRLADAGLRVQRLGDVYHPIERTGPAQEGTYYGGYHTSTAHAKHLDDVAAQFPALTKLHTIGSSYLKTTGKGGYDLRAMCISAIKAGDCEMRTDSPKPKFAMMAQVHARELVTGELAWKWIDWLTQNYGKDAEVTNLLDTRELWVIPIANPDGVDKVASNPSRPLMHRKNMNYTNGANCGDSDNAHSGVDLNRNSSFKWGRGDDACSSTYPGPSGASEPETQALEKLFRGIFADYREDDTTSVAKPGVRNTATSLHSFGEMLIYAWGYTKSPAPDRAKLNGIAKKIAEMNRYRAGQPGDLLGYTGNGSQDDFVYGALGVPFITFEFGGQTGGCGGFAPKYSCVDTLWNQNKAAFVHLAKIADNPYGSVK